MLRAWPKSGFVRWSISIMFFIAVLFLAIVSRQPGETARLNLTPFLAIKRAVQLLGPTIFSGIKIKSRILLMDVVLNILLFVPAGYILPCLSSKLAHWWAAVPLGFVLSFCIEFTQYAAKLGTADVDDLINNTIGAMLGWILYLIILKKVRWAPERSSKARKNTKSSSKKR